MEYMNEVDKDIKGVDLSFFLSFCDCCGFDLSPLTVCMNSSLFAFSLYLNGGFQFYAVVAKQLRMFVVVTL